MLSGQADTTAIPGVEEPEMDEISLLANIYLVQDLQKLIMLSRRSIRSLGTEENSRHDVF